MAAADATEMMSVGVGQSRIGIMVICLFVLSPLDALM